MFSSVLRVQTRALFSAPSRLSSTPRFARVPVSQSFARLLSTSHARLAQGAPREAWDGSYEDADADAPARKRFSSPHAKFVRFDGDIKISSAEAPSDDQATATLYIGNLDHSATAEDLQEMFGQFGDCKIRMRECEDRAEACPS